MVSAGEASGDLHASHALQALSRTDTSYSCFGMGSEKLEAAGAELLVDFGDLAVIGFVDVLVNYPRFLARLKLLRQAMHRRKPDLLLLVDFPDFNFKLAKTAKQLGIPVLYYISPKFWAWRPSRLHRLGELVSHMAVIFPFEVPYFERENIPVTYVGNPLVDSAVSSFTTEQARQHLGLDPVALTVGLLPGSRQGELKRLLPLLLESAHALQQQYSAIQFVLPKAASLTTQAVDEILAEQPADKHVLPLVTDGDACNVMRACDVTICASGTATLENAMIGTPTVLVYKINALNYAIMSRLIRIADIGLVNIVAGKRIVPELVQHDARPERIVAEVAALLNSPEQASAMRADLTRVREKMGSPGASDRLAALIESML